MVLFSNVTVCESESGRLDVPATDFGNNMKWSCSTGDLMCLLERDFQQQESTSLE